MTEWKRKGFMQVNRGLFVIFIHLAVIESNLGSRKTRNTARTFVFFKTAMNLLNRCCARKCINIKRKPNRLKNVMKAAKTLGKPYFKGSRCVCEVLSAQPRYPRTDICEYKDWGSAPGWSLYFKLMSWTVVTNWSSCLVLSYARNLHRDFKSNSRRDWNM